MKHFSKILISLVSIVAFACNRPEPNYEGVLMTDYGRNGLESFKTVTGAQGPLGPGSELYQVPMFEDKGDCDPVKGFVEARAEKANADRLMKKLEYYRHTYPFHKFINKESVKAICGKYGLLLTEVKRYISDIPEKNQKEIVDFRIKRKDIREPFELEMNGALAVYRSISKLHYLKPNEDERVPGSHLLILAPEHKLNVKGLTKVGHILKIDDPVVLQPVEEGYLIVSSWGLEASDELILNPINN